MQTAGRSICRPTARATRRGLIALRYLLIQDWDLDEDGKPDSLRLMYGVPRRWLADGRQIAGRKRTNGIRPDVASSRVEVE